MKSIHSKKYKTGYLHDDFRIFYLRTQEKKEFAGHYHDFHKLLYFLNGSVSYYIEGEVYQLLPGDIVLVPAGEMHRPVIQDTVPYERMILYISSSFFDPYQSEDCDLYRLFAQCQNPDSHTLRISDLRETPIHRVMHELIEARRDDAFAARLYRQSLLLELLILLNRILESGNLSFPAASGSNPHILEVLSYINGHLDDPILSVDTIAANCFLNRSYLMHLFRQETGYTIGNYLTEKRLFSAKRLIQQGISVTDACLQSGFTSYASFYRAYRKKFGASPKSTRQKI